jgi:hypothetical protein
VGLLALDLRAALQLAVATMQVQVVAVQALLV